MFSWTDGWAVPGPPFSPRHSKEAFRPGPACTRCEILVAPQDNALCKGPKRHHRIRRIRVRALILACVVATGFASVALAGSENQGTTTIVKPPAPAVTAPPPAPAPAPAPVVTAPPPPPPAPVVADVPWPDNVPKIKPWTGGMPLDSAKS